MRLSLRTTVLFPGCAPFVLPLFPALPSSPDLVSDLVGACVWLRVRRFLWWVAVCGGGGVSGSVWRCCFVRWWCLGGGGIASYLFFFFYVVGCFFFFADVVMFWVGVVGWWCSPVLSISEGFFIKIFA